MAGQKALEAELRRLRDAYDAEQDVARDQLKLIPGKEPDQATKVRKAGLQGRMEAFRQAGGLVGVAWAEVHTRKDMPAAEAHRILFRTRLGVERARDVATACREAATARSPAVREMFAARCAAAREVQDRVLGDLAPLDALVVDVAGRPHPPPPPPIKYHVPPRPGR